MDTFINLKDKNVTKRRKRSLDEIAWQKELACCANSSERFEYSDLLNVNLGLRQEFPFVVTIASIGTDAVQLRTTNICPTFIRQDRCLEVIREMVNNSYIENCLSASDETNAIGKQQMQTALVLLLLAGGDVEDVGVAEEVGDGVRRVPNGAGVGARSTRDLPIKYAYLNIPISTNTSQYGYCGFQATADFGIIIIQTVHSAIAMQTT
uniref:Uncharacterized protein n=1 Tax=Glossina austeni TaxID=7395 RepID=A0A1A9VIQ4_GLOAU